MRRIKNIKVKIAKKPNLGIQKPNTLSSSDKIKIKKQAYIEFAKRLENEINIRTTLSRKQDKNVIHMMNNLLKEMVGEE